MSETERPPSTALIKRVALIITIGVRNQFSSHTIARNVIAALREAGVMQ